MVRVYFKSRFIPTRKALPGISWFKLCDRHTLLLTIMLVSTSQNKKHVKYTRNEYRHKSKHTNAHSLLSNNID